VPDEPVKRAQVGLLRMAQDRSCGISARETLVRQAFGAARGAARDEGARI